MPACNLYPPPLPPASSRIRPPQWVWVAMGLWPTSPPTFAVAMLPDYLPQFASTHTQEAHRIAEPVSDCRGPNAPNGARCGGVNSFSSSCALLLSSPTALNQSLHTVFIVLGQTDKRTAEGKATTGTRESARPRSPSLDAGRRRQTRAGLIDKPECYTYDANSPFPTTNAGAMGRSMGRRKDRVSTPQ